MPENRLKCVIGAFVGCGCKVCAVVVPETTKASAVAGSVVSCCGLAVIYSFNNIIFNLIKIGWLKQCFNLSADVSTISNL